MTGRFTKGDPRTIACARKGGSSADNRARFTTETAKEAGRKGGRAGRGDAKRRTKR